MSAGRTYKRPSSPCARRPGRGAVVRRHLPCSTRWKPTAGCWRSPPASPTAALRHCLESHGLHARFVSLQTADRHPSKPHPAWRWRRSPRPARRPKPASSSATPASTSAWRMAAGAGAIGAAWGYHERGGTGARPARMASPRSRPTSDHRRGNGWRSRMSDRRRLWRKRFSCSCSCAWSAWRPSCSASPSPITRSAAAGRLAAGRRLVIAAGASTRFSLRGC